MPIKFVWEVGWQKNWVYLMKNVLGWVAIICLPTPPTKFVVTISCHTTLLSTFCHDTAKKIFYLTHKYLAPCLQDLFTGTHHTIVCHAIPSNILFHPTPKMFCLPTKKYFVMLPNPLTKSFLLHQSKRFSMPLPKKL